MTTPIVTELQRTLERITTDPFIHRVPSHLVLVEPGGIPMADPSTSPNPGAVDAADR
jgi:hypothetical protein